MWLIVKTWYLNSKTFAGNEANLKDEFGVQLHFDKKNFFGIW